MKRGSDGRYDLYCGPAPQQNIYPLSLSCLLQPKENRYVDDRTNNSNGQ